VKRGIAELLAEAGAEVETLSVRAARELHANDAIAFVDLRERAEREREGAIPGAFHCPRGVLEFWIDPASPYHKGVFSEGRPILFYCASGWRSALAAKTAQDMGLPGVAHLEGGFAAWRAAGCAVVPPGPSVRA
jgi:rhodanese-related sulfurtransferase